MSTLSQIFGLEDGNEAMDSSLLFANRTNVRCKRGSVEQKGYLLNFLENDPDFAQDRYEGAEGRRLQNEKWQQLATELNNIEGARKNGQEWRKYWRDLVLRTKARAQEFHANAKKEPMYRKALKPFSTEELQIIKILTCDDVKSNVNPKPNHRKHASCPNEIKNEPPPTPTPAAIESTTAPKIVSFGDLVAKFQTSTCSLESMQENKNPGDINAVDYVLGDSTTQITNMDEFQDMLNQKYAPTQNAANHGKMHSPMQQSRTNPTSVLQQHHQQQHSHQTHHPHGEAHSQQHSQHSLSPPPITAVQCNIGSRLSQSTSCTDPQNQKRRRKSNPTVHLLKWVEKKFDNIESIEAKKVKLMEDRNELLKQIAASLKDINEKMTPKI